MSAQQIKLNINTLVDNIDDESVLDACYEVLSNIVKIAKNSRNSLVLKEETKTQPVSFVEENNKVSEPLIVKNEAENALDDVVEKVMPHDLSLVFLANDIFKGTGPIPAEGAIAFKKALLKSATTKPVFTN